jgi:rod shape-determining protein MreD
LWSFRGKPQSAPFVGPPWYVAALWLLVAVVVQTTIVHDLAIRSVVPSLVLVVVVWYAIRVDALRAAFFGLAAGLCDDVLSPQTGASWTLSTLFTSVVTSILSRGFFADSVPLAAAVTAIATLLRALLFWTFMSLGGYPAGLGAMHAREALLAAALNVVVMTAATLVSRRFGERAA